jgi:hypothetical protein
VCRTAVSDPPPRPASPERRFPGLVEIELQSHATPKEIQHKVLTHWMAISFGANSVSTRRNATATYVIASNEGQKLVRFFEKYGVSAGQSDLGDFGDFAEGMDGALSSRDTPII